MPSFRYIVVNKDNKQLAGEIDAPGIDIAREDLKELGFSIVSIEEKPETAVEEAGQIFEFNGIDNENRSISGTIKSESRYQAFKRLISEYELDIRYLLEKDANEEEKAKQKREGIKDFMRKYQEEVKKRTDMFHKKKFKKIDRNFEKKKALVMRQVDFVMKKVDEAVSSFASELAPEHKQSLKDYVNKVLRLKNSTNLDYLKKTTEDLLKFLQKAEIFVSKSARLNDKLKLYAETEDMIDHLEKGQDFGVYEDLEDQILRWQSEHIKGNKHIPFINKIQNIYYSILLRIIHQPEEARAINKELHFLNRETRQYYGVVLKAKDQNYKEEALKSIKKLKTQKNRLKSKLKKVQEDEKNKMKEMGELSFTEQLLDSINGITGWLLFLYLLLYFTSEIIISKQIFFEIYSIPTIFFIFKTGLIKYVLPIVFLLHATTSLKLNFFKKSIIANILLFPVFAIFTLLVLFNF